jgi:hypothetical protein
VRDDIIERAVDAIGAPGGRREACRAEVRRAASTLRSIESCILTASPGEARRAFQKYATALARVRHAAVGLPFLRPPKEFMSLLEREEKRSRSALPPDWRGAAKPRDMLKLAAVAIAREVLHAHGKATSLTDGGPWPTLASTLYESATDGGAAVDLWDYCRHCDDPKHNLFVEFTKLLFRQGAQDLVLKIEVTHPGC